MNKLKRGTEPQTARSNIITNPRYIYKLDKNKMANPRKVRLITLI